jgi:hypothetical protein
MCLFIKHCSATALFKIKFISSDSLLWSSVFLIKDPTALEGLILSLTVETDEEFAARWRTAEELVALGTQVVAPLLQALTHMQEVRSILLNHGIHHILHALNGKKNIQPVFTILEDIDIQVKVSPAAKKVLQSLV